MTNKSIFRYAATIFLSFGVVCHATDNTKNFLKAETIKSVSNKSQLVTSSYRTDKNPRERIQKLNKQLQSLNSSENERRFLIGTELVELYFKTEQLPSAKKHLSSLNRDYAQQTSYAPKLALLNAHLQLIELDIESFHQTLQPYINVYSDPAKPELNACYLNLLAAYQIKRQKYEQAFKNLTIAEEIAETYSLSHLKQEIRNQLVQLHYLTQRFQIAIDINNEILEHAKNHHDQFGMLKALSNKMNLLYIKAVKHSETMSDEEALADPLYKNLMNESNQTQSKVFALSQSLGAFRSLAKSLILMQNQHFAKGEFQQAIDVGMQVVDIAEQHGYDYERAVAYNNISIAQRELGSFENSLTSLREAEQYYSKINSLQSLIWVYDDYSITYELAKNYELALDYQKRFYRASVELLNKSNQQTLLEIQEKYQADRKTQEIENLKHESLIAAQRSENEKMARSLLVVIVSALILIAGVLMHKRKKLKRLLLKESLLHKEAKEVSEAKQRFFSNLSHEFRTALTLSIGPLKKLINQNLVDNKPLLDCALENNLHMLTLLNEVLDLEKIDSQQAPISVKEIELRDAIDSISKRFIAQYAENQISLNFDKLSHDIKVYFDVSHLEKIISNILSNAGKYCDNQCLVEISAKSDSKTTQVIICDNGPGIDEKELPFIFNRFYQGQRSTQKQLPGTGIGLSLVKELMELHQGSVSIISGKRKGCCVKLTFKSGKAHYPKDYLVQFNPHSSESETQHSCRVKRDIKTIESKVSSQSSSLISGDVQRKTILVVDDNAKIRSLIRSILQPDFHIVEAENGESALKLALNIQPDLVITDVMMPLMNGYQLTEKLRQDKRLSYLSILFLTALTETEQQKYGLQLGADDYITKPFDNDTLKLRVTNLLHRKEVLSQFLLDQYRPQLSINEPPIKFEGQDEKRDKKLHEQILENLGDYTFGVAEMYQSVNMTRSSLYRFTQKYYGCSPMNLLKRKRLEAAYKILQQNDSNISEVAYAVGYQSLSAFSRAFKDYYDIPPTKVKRTPSVGKKGKTAQEPNATEVDH